MAVKLEVYRCDICGNIVEVLAGGAGELVCCGQPMNLLEGNTTDAATEKHVPVIEKTENGYLVKVGSVPHPMEEKHYIQWIELIVDNTSHIAFLSPGQKPEALFQVSEGAAVMAREYCNIHGFWKVEIN